MLEKHCSALVSVKVSHVKGYVGTNYFLNK